MTTQSTATTYTSDSAPFKTKAQYIESNPAITPGGLEWLIFHKREALEKVGALTYFGRKILIHEGNLNQYILAGGTRVIGGVL